MVGGKGKRERPEKGRLLSKIRVSSASKTLPIQPTQSPATPGGLGGGGSAGGKKNQPERRISIFLGEGRVRKSKFPVKRGRTNPPRDIGKKDFSNVQLFEVENLGEKQ